MLYLKKKVYFSTQTYLASALVAFHPQEVISLSLSHPKLFTQILTKLNARVQDIFFKPLYVIACCRYFMNRNQQSFNAIEINLIKNMIHLLKTNMEDGVDDSEGSFNDEQKEDLSMMSDEDLDFMDF